MRKLWPIKLRDYIAFNSGNGRGSNGGRGGYGGTWISIVSSPAFKSMLGKNNNQLQTISVLPSRCCLPILTHLPSAGFSQIFVPEN